MRIEGMFIIKSLLKGNKHFKLIFGQVKMIYSFNLYNSLAPDGIYASLKKFIKETTAPPVVLCVGSDLSVGDSLGPLVGTMIKERLSEHNIYVYGTLSKPITAHESAFINRFLTQTHPMQKVIAVDAAVGNVSDIGLIKIFPGGLKPGSGVNNSISKVGDISVMGIVAQKSLLNYALFSATRLNMVYRMANIISDGIVDFYEDFLSRRSISL